MKSDVICLWSNLCCNCNNCLVVSVQDGKCVCKWEWLITSDLDYNTSWFNKIIQRYHKSDIIQVQWSQQQWWEMCGCVCVHPQVSKELITIWVCNCHMDSNTTTIWTVTCDFSKQCTLSFFTRHNTTMLCHAGNFLNHLTFVDVETLQAMLTQPQSPVSENPGTKLNLMHNRSRERAHTHI